MIKTISAFILPCIIVFILTYALFKKVNLYEAFIDGAKEGLKTSINVIPYIVAIMVAVGMFRASGAIDNIATLLQKPLAHFHVPADVLPIMFIRSLSGSANIGLLGDIVSNVGPDNYTAKLAAIMVGSSETTFYVLSVYFGAVGIKKFRYSLLAGILADAMGIVMAVAVASFMFL